MLVYFCIDLMIINWVVFNRKYLWRKPAILKHQFLHRCYSHTFKKVGMLSLSSIKVPIKFNVVYLIFVTTWHIIIFKVACFNQHHSNQKYLILFLFCLFTNRVCANPSQKPVIGIYTEDIPEPNIFQEYSMYVMASYVKNIQMAGAQVVPIFYNLPISQLKDLLFKVNGVFFPGGQASININNQWTSKMKFIIDYANEQNYIGNVFPIWGTCLGMQAVMYLFGGYQDNSTVLSEVIGQIGVIRPLKVLSNESQILKCLPSIAYDQITSQEGIYYFNHHRAVLLQTFQKIEGLNKFWKVITTTTTSNGVQFISTVQAKDYPYFLVQYHPEKTVFESKADIPRTYVTIQAQQRIIGMFVQYSRKNTNSFPQNELQKKLIENYPTMYMGRIMPQIPVNQIYLF